MHELDLGGLALFALRLAQFVAVHVLIECIDRMAQI